MSGDNHNQADEPADASREDNGGEWCKGCERYFIGEHSHAGHSWTRGVFVAEVQRLRET